MGKSTFSGPVQSENGFKYVEKSGTTGKYADYTTVAGEDARRYVLKEYFDQRPALNAVIQAAFSAADATDGANTTIKIAASIANRQFEVLGEGMTTALVTRPATKTGITMTSDTADEDQCVLTPHLDTNMSGWTGNLWGTENQVEWECSISTAAAIDNQKVWAGLKLTFDHLIAADANQAFFKFATDADNGEALDDFTKLHFIYSVANVDYISQLPITVAAATEYFLQIKIDENRKISIFVNGIQYNVASVAGSTGGTAVTEVAAGQLPVKSLALTDDISLIPYIAIETGAAGAESLDVHYTGISRVNFE